MRVASPFELVEQAWKEVFHRFGAHGKRVVGVDNLVLLDCMNEASQGGLIPLGQIRGRRCLRAHLAEQKPQTLSEPNASSSSQNTESTLNHIYVDSSISPAFRLSFLISNRLPCTS